MTDVEIGTRIAALSSAELRGALDRLPEGAELFKVYVTGNLAVLLDGEQIGVIDLARYGGFDDWREPLDK
jgi:hypothetical protein